jgi:hypothetical protein
MYQERLTRAEENVLYFFMIIFVLYNYKITLELAWFTITLRPFTDLFFYTINLFF